VLCTLNFGDATGFLDCSALRVLTVYVEMARLGMLFGFFLLSGVNFNLWAGEVKDDFGEVSGERRTENGPVFQSTLGGYSAGVLERLRAKGLNRSERPSPEVVGAGLSFSREWKQGVISTVFWVGEKAVGASPSNERSAWDNLWMEHFGGYDTPADGARSPWYTPLAFRPLLNPFYCALPYCDLVEGKFRPEACAVIPWFFAVYRGSGCSVCKDHWVAIYAHGRVAFAQWEDVGPICTDDWAYVFGPETGPRRGLDGSEKPGIDVSPAVRSYLGLSGVDRVNWRFVEAHQVAPGPWQGWEDRSVIGQTVGTHSR
jgi:hypothetical protein